ncbi:MAG: orotidine-5'-phosphate decarboxylase [Brevibacterium sp.]|uniref:orotidine-5'-phosphate decarboxylase n=1 Tax=Brevibacterium sp. TaxID=1701 RepID=UPI002648DA8B|nr:orotidine-5'-phosphate decarboxylase [Brevibacterium sp.]MDN5832428.1 orotidine-5'-phosphate decarboxylase [Brevibacterium sp.]MDN5875087.1 orotidine-5'-phosphate decarboxylase [Brevibacterium sp.]MDN6157038.1 orotidine-5'-phosphate decarboxylase [Brevibacterium sp.]MDN6187268.1 orotidine-5'-phosphate decarboxylase [Brevibacterium sp.]MDN6190817.1 orotidine-5'-phosphate decarboxylase [Brevibacterium sp.]
MFGPRLRAAMDEHGPLCVGIDPHDHLLEAWGLPRTAAGVREFSLRTVTELAGSVAAVKPQSAFYEQYGSAGVAVLEETLAACREHDLISVLDVKRGDIGSTMGAYARAYLDPASALAADSITVSPYLGFGALDPAFDLAEAHDRGVFVLALTSNPEGAEVQHARRDSAVSGFGDSVAGSIVAQVAARNGIDAAQGLGRIGLVVGATIGSGARDLGFDPSTCGGPILAPGVGAQGAGIAELIEVFGHEAIAANQILATTSRAVLSAGPEGVRAATRSLNESLTRVA